MFSVTAHAYDWSASPHNWDYDMQSSNVPNNYDNSRNNDPYSPDNFGDKKIIYDNHGNENGFAMQKRDGGVNFYNKDGSHRGSR